MKKISFLVLHLGYGGIESASINTANALSKYYDVEIVSFYNLEKNNSKLLSPKIKVNYLSKHIPNKDKLINSIKRFDIVTFLSEILKSLSILRNKCYLVKKWIKNSDSDVIVSTRIEFNLLLDKYGKESTLKIVQEHQYHNNDNKYLSKIKKYKNIDVLMALTTVLKTDYEKLIKNKNIDIVLMPNMLNNDPVKIAPLNQKKLISIGRLHPGKRVEEAIQCFLKANNDWEFVIVGDGDEFNYLSQKYINNKNIIFLGRKNSNEINNLLFNSSIFIMTSISEGLPMVLLEAMRVGIPCIAYETASGVSDIINNKNGFVIKNRNEKEMIQKLTIMMNDKNMLKKMQKECLKTAESFSEKTILSKWISVIEKEDV